MIAHRLTDARELINKVTNRHLLSYAYVALFAALTVSANFLWLRSNLGFDLDNLGEVFYLIVAVIVLSSVDVRMERGRLNLGSIPLGVAALLFSPVSATLVGIALGTSIRRRGAWPLLGNAVMAGTYGCFCALAAAALRVGGSLPLGQRILVLALLNVSTWIFITFGLAIRTGEPVRSIVAHNFTREFYAAYAYFGLASLLTSYLLNGSLLGYLLATIVFVLSLALTDTIAGRRVRRVLESELSDADRHLFHSRAVEGVVHNLRNHMATAVGYLKEIDLTKLDSTNRDAVETASAAANDAVSVLRTLAQGATPRVTYAPEPVELNDLVSRALGMARPRARAKEIELGLRESPENVKVRGDPLLLREVITNLLNNAIDAAPQHGHVELSTGRRSNSWPFFSVADNGPGVADENRHHLFEPHFTTKETGTGLGLFMSYGIIREHQGQLLYEGNRHGAVFTAVLPPTGG